MVYLVDILISLDNLQLMDSDHLGVSRYTAREPIIQEIIRSMRPHQWYKNLVIFIGIIFSSNMFSLEMWPYSLSAFIVFCLISGCVYIINDIKDVEADRLHPKKRFRPIALGNLSPKVALEIAVLIMAISLAAAFVISRQLFHIGLIYIFINLLYTFFLKSFALIDVMVIAMGFILRAVAGSLAINVRVSPWLVLCVFLMAFMLAFGKRRHELIFASTSHASLPQYNEKLIESLMNISVAMLLMSYALYSFSVDIYMMITLPFAFYGIFRFLQLVYTDNFGGSTELILKDRASLANLALWTASAIVVLYGVGS